MESSILKKLEEKLPCNVFVYMFNERRLPKRFLDFKKLSVQVLPVYNDPGLWDHFRDEFIEDETAELIFIGSKVILENYFQEVNQAYLPDRPDFANDVSMHKAKKSWQKGDMVFILVRRAPDLWYFKGGVYNPV